MSNSSGNSPHRFSGSVDAFYDPDFTADISKKMRVPEKIIINDRMNGHHFDDPAIIAAKTQTSTDEKPIWMTVPERILVMGNDHHVSSRGPLPELKLENSMLGMGDDYGGDHHMSPVHQLSTPPHTLTLDEHTFPTVGDNTMSGQHVSNGPYRTAGIYKKKRNVALSGFADDITLDNSRKESLESPEYQSYINSNNSMADLSGDESSAASAVVIRRQVKAMSRRVAAIELDNQHRHQREVFIYTIGVIYFLVKGFLWIQRRL